MKSKYKIFIIVYIALLSIIWNYNSELFKNIVSDLNYVSCGSATGIPTPAPKLTSAAFSLLVIGAPLALIAFSIVTLVKAIVSSNAEEISKSRNKLIKKIILTMLIYVSAALVQFVINKVASNTSDKESISKCLRCFLYFSYDNCPQSSTGNDIYRGTNRRTNDNSSIGTEAEIRREKSKKKSSSDDVILVGDSRTVQMCGISSTNTVVPCKDYSAVAYGGKGSTWFKDYAISGVTSELNKNSGKTYDILILLGANDVGENAGAEKYAMDIYKSELPKLAKGDWKNHNVIFVMLTCGDKAQAKSNGMSISQSQIDNFNAQVKEFIKNENIDNLNYCTITDVPRQYLSDGVHYTPDGYNFYYNQIKENCVN